MNRTLTNRMPIKLNPNLVIKRNYDSILKAPQAPSAFQFQTSKLQTVKAINLNAAYKHTFYSRLQQLNLWSLRHPIMLGAAISTSKSGIADGIAQFGIESRDLNTFNWSRFILFSAFGLFYGGFVQYGVYNKLYPILFKNMEKGMMRTTTITMTDMILHSTFFYFPIFYVFKGAVYERNVSLELIKKQLHQYFAVNFNEDVKSLFKVWTPAMFVMFAVVPFQYRVPWVSMFGVIWAIILSLKRGDAQEERSCSPLSYPAIQSSKL